MKCALSSRLAVSQSCGGDGVCVWGGGGGGVSVLGGCSFEDSYV